MDSLTEMLEDMRKAQPTEENWQEFPAWLEAVAWAITMHEDELRQKAYCLLIGDDICKATGSPIYDCVHIVTDAVRRQRKGVTR